MEVNSNIRERPRLAHDAPYEEGWLFLLEPISLEHELKGLYFGDDTYKWVDMENQRLLELSGPEYRKLASTGGSPMVNLSESILKFGWGRLISTFLHTKKTS